MRFNRDRNLGVPADTNAKCEDAEAFDVFLAYNRRDRDYVRMVHAALKRHGVNAWIDEEQIVAGGELSHSISKALAAIPVVAVFIGAHGVEGWQEIDHDAAIASAAQDRQRVIPVLLPGVRKVPEDQSFLRAIASIDFSEEKPEQEKVELLIRGIRKFAS